MLFFSPIVIFYLQDDAVIGFILATITSILLGIVVSMNVYVFRHSKLNIGLASFLSGELFIKHLIELPDRLNSTCDNN